MALVEDITKELDELKAIRRYLHAHPDLGFEEHGTASVIAQELTKHGIAHVAAQNAVSRNMDTLDAAAVYALCKVVTQKGDSR